MFFLKYEILKSTKRPDLIRLISIKKLVCDSGFVQERSIDVSKHIEATR